MTPCPKCLSYDREKIRVVVEKTTGEIKHSIYRCKACGNEFDSGAVHLVPVKNPWYSKIWTYTKFLFGVGWFGGRTYVRKRYGVDIGPKPYSERTPEEHDEAYIMDTAKGQVTVTLPALNGSVEPELKVLKL